MLQNMTLQNNQSHIFSINYLNYNLANNDDKITNVTVHARVLTAIMKGDGLCLPVNI